MNYNEVFKAFLSTHTMYLTIFLEHKDALGLYEQLGIKSQHKNYSMNTEFLSFPLL